MNQKKIGVFVGSLRRDSYNRAIAKEFCGLMPASVKMEMMEIGTLPPFNQDFDDDGSTPDSWKLFRQSVGELDGFLFVTPEYNRSYPAVLKNALDIASRPHGQNLWSGKPGAIISASPGKIGGFGATQHLRQVLAFLNVYVMAQPEVYVGNVESVLDYGGHITDKGLHDFLASVADAFVVWINRVSG